MPSQAAKDLLPTKNVRLVQVQDLLVVEKAERGVQQGSLRRHSPCVRHRVIQARPKAPNQAPVLHRAQARDLLTRKQQKYTIVHISIVRSNMR